MTDELKQWEYDKGYAKGYEDCEKAKQIVIDALNRLIDNARNDAINEMMAELIRLMPYDANLYVEIAERLRDKRNE